MQDSNFRQVCRGMYLLLAIKRQAREEAAWKKPSVSWNVHENTVG
jgi:hypothetical protein